MGHKRKESTTTPTHIPPFVSVIIPVFNDLKRLQVCLEALENQTYPNTRYEVIAVDNGSAESIEAIVNRFTQALSTNESRIGSYAARNRGLSHAKGEIIAFTDSDCIPACDWIEKGVENLLRVPNCGLIGGKINIFFKNKNQPTVVELYDTIVGLLPKESIEVENFALTANLFTFKTVFDHVGPFNDNFKSAGDTDWGQRVFAYGFKLLYADDTIVSHPARNSLAQLYKKEIRVTGGYHTLMNEKKSNSFIKFLFKLPVELLPPIRRSLTICSDERIKGVNQKIKLIFLLVLLKYLRLWKRLRLHLGLSPTRS